jgi:phage terminase large subunit GpA-like protein
MVQTHHLQNNYLQGFIKGLEILPPLTVSEWAELYRYLPASASAEEGCYRVSRTPYLKEPMDCLSASSPVKRVCAFKCTQIGWTELANNWLFYIAHYAPGPTMMVFPTSKLAEKHSKTKIASSLDAMPIIKDLIRTKRRGRQGGDSVEVKEFPGGFWAFLGSNSAAALRSASIKNLILDDMDGFCFDAGGEGDSVDLVKKRTDSFSATSKVLEISTGTVKGLSRIERAFETSDQSYYHVPCPNCHTKQVLKFGDKTTPYGLKWCDHTPSTVYYQCPYCNHPIQESQKLWMFKEGVWIPTYPERTLERGFHLNSLYSPIGWVSWAKVVDEYLKSYKRPEAYKVWVNTRDAHCYESVDETINIDVLEQMAEHYKIMTVPAPGLFLTCGVDVQYDRLAVTIYAWGREDKSYLILWCEIFGNTAEPEIWVELEGLISRKYQHVYGVELPVSCTAIDSGSRTQVVYNFVRTHKRVMAIKGASEKTAPILKRPTAQDVDCGGQVIRNGILLWGVGVTKIKELLYGRLVAESRKPKPNEVVKKYFYQYIDISKDYFDQLTSEKQITKYIKGFPVKEWLLPSGKRNEALDCTCYAYAAAVRIGLVTMDWAKLELILGANIKRAEEPSLILTTDTLTDENEDKILTDKNKHGIAIPLQSINKDSVKFGQKINSVFMRNTTLRG